MGVVLAYGMGPRVERVLGKARMSGEMALAIIIIEIMILAVSSPQDLIAWFSDAPSCRSVENSRDA